ncbi:hypothetical protein PCANC_15176 [Puccinia coronata f. sp. avenae]|uniref:Uncharacterized protein n=1 Tax=Puccinia coronata f. sp. avenae TaxID=200324 RepID=A0A2N5UJH5_9BASI|nr:hypothetical protein PCANC_15176 [Puccinia coronata f. sp. avenae]
MPSNHRRTSLLNTFLVAITPRSLPQGLIAARPKGVRTPPQTPKKQGVHMASRRAEPARLSGRRAKPARPLDRRAGFARLWAHVSLSNREAYVSRGTLIRVLRTLIAGLTSAS